MFKFIICSLCMALSVSTYAQTVAKAGAKNISKAEFEKSYKRALQNSRSLKRLPTRAEHLEDMVRFNIGMQEAERSNVKSNPAVKQALDLALYKGLLEVKLSKKIEKIKVSNSDMKSYYARNPQMRSGHIFIRLPDNPTSKQVAETEERAQKIYSDVVTNKKKWSVNVRTYTDDNATKATGGDLGYHGSGTLYPAYYKALKPLAVGQVIGPVRGLYGFHIIKKLGQLSYERSDKNTIKLAVFNTKRFQILDKYFSDLKKKYKVSYNKDAL